MLLANLDAVCLEKNEGNYYYYLCIGKGQTNFIVDIEHSLLNLFINFLRCIDESFLNVRCRASGCFHEDQTMLSGKGFTLLLFYLATRVQITKMTNASRIRPI